MKEISILIADDDEAVCQLLHDYITTMGCRVDLAYDGKKALACLGSKRYDFVFLDCNMPELTGLEVAGYIKNEKGRPKIIMMTGYGSMDENFANAAGVDIYLKKPILLDVVKKIIKKEICGK